MKPGSLIPFRGEFENAKAFLHHIASDDEIESFAIITVLKDGSVGFAHLKMTRANMAYASIVLAEWSRSSGQ